MIKYFIGVTALDQLRALYKALLKANHPDNGGDENTMKEINMEYETVFKALKAGQTITDETPKAEKMAWDEQQDLNIREALKKIIFFDGINIEIVGSWIWVDGLTFPFREELKNAGYTWSKARKKWHFCPYETTHYYKGKKKSFDAIRATYGSQTVSKSSDPVLE